jgi:hypothetical protein
MMRSISRRSITRAQADLLPALGLDENLARADGSGTAAVLPDALGSKIGLIN